MLLDHMMRPEYILRPKQILQRIKFGIFAKNIKSKLCRVDLPWQVPLEIHTQDEIGRSIMCMGVYDLTLTEVLWRLIDKGDTVIDVGANCGYVSSLMAKRVGKSGKVICFEPHPSVFEDLSRNVKIWEAELGWKQLDIIENAISDYEGMGQLNIPPDFINNRGMAHFYEEGEKPEINHGEIQVEVTSLDRVISKMDLQKIGLVKIDVEGHEKHVLKGLENSIRAGRVRDIIFEDASSNWRTVKDIWNEYHFLEQYGFTIFRLKRGFTKPKIEKLKNYALDQSLAWSSWEPPNYFATTDVDRFLKRFERCGWFSLRNGTS